MNTVDYSYLFGETLLSIDNFAELFLACSEFDDGVLDINRKMVYTELPFEYEDIIDDCMYNTEEENINIVAKLCPIIDVDLYYNNANKWHKNMYKSLNKYIFENKDIYVKIDEEKNANIIGLPTKKVFEIINKYDNDIVNSMMYLTNYIKNNKENELTKLKKMIDSTGGVNQFNGYSE